MYPDHEARKRMETLYIVWTRNLRQCSTDCIAAKLAAEHRQGIPTRVSHYRDGAYNRCYKVTFQKGPDAIVRLPMLGKVLFRKQKTDNEVVTMAYISQSTSIPVPVVRGNGICGSGPYIVMDFIEGDLLSDHLQAPLLDRREASILDPDISIDKLRAAYREMAHIILKLSKCQFSHIGSLVRDTNGGWSAGKPPLTHNINELLTYANFPPFDICDGPFSTANEYFKSLAEMHIQHLRLRKNNAVDNESDCREILFCDDLRPSNIIVDSNLHVKGVIDWEFCYAAPVEFTHCSPWRLLLAHPDDWINGLDSFLTQYMPRHRIFLDSLRECESESAKNGIIDHTLSDHMEQSMRNGDFWVCLAARSSFAFDDIYWKFIDQRYYGDFTSLENRIDLLNEDERAELDGLFERKMEQAAGCGLDPHWTVDRILAS